MSKKTFKLSEAVTVEGETFTEVTMRHFKGRDLIAFKARAEELRDAGDEGQFILCEIASDAPAELFLEMEIVTFAKVLEFMAPSFKAISELVGNDPKTASKAPSN